ncbi:acyltransferase [Lysinibacillus capsici]|uniref:Acyltransferase n=1 Tax=Lysinibacillus capsici TaxID=2115968 RepID=A0A2X0ZBT7_9BACI|nr:acyltransferase family protein [Lysinibacillus capsici]SPT99941.1 acyltransferase [Lysinibacillus capsici]
MKREVKEIYLLRYVACLGIVLMHSVTLALNMYDIEEGPLFVILTSIQLIFMFGTPLFIFISEFVIAYSYSDRLPKKFYVKRYKYMLTPFLFIGLLDAVLKSIESPSIEFAKKLLLNYLEGDFHGYFIVIIFQFYIIHPFFVKFIASRYPAYKVIMTAFIINFGYLAFFNFLDPFKYFPDLAYTSLQWDFFNKMPFPAWIAYFAVAYYCGKNYDKFLSWLQRFRFLLLAVLLITVSLLLTTQLSGIITEVHSKRIDVILYTFSVAFLLFFIASNRRKMPEFIIFISRYSFGIYLLHPLVNSLLKIFLTNFIETLSVFSVIAISFIVSLSCSICITYIMSKWKLGAFLIGQLNTNGDSSNKKDAQFPIQKS